MKRKKLWKKKNHLKNQAMDMNTIVENTIVQPQHQENSNDKKYKIELLESIQNDFIAQSTSLSNVMRWLAGVVIGTIWAICYREKEVVIPNSGLLLSVIFSITFLIIELCHYWIDSRFYHNKSDQIVNSGGCFDLGMISREVQSHSKISYIFLNLKFFVVLLFSVAFIVGVGNLYHFNDNKDKISTTPQIKQELKSPVINNTDKELWMKKKK